MFSGVQLNYQFPKIHNEAPSDVNKLLDGWTYSGWKMTGIALKKIGAVHKAIGYHPGPVAPPTADGASLQDRNPWRWRPNNVSQPLSQKS